MYGSHHQEPQKHGRNDELSSEEIIDRCKVWRPEIPGRMLSDPLFWKIHIGFNLVLFWILDVLFWIGRVVILGGSLDTARLCKLD
jgi:hypothetical protein